MRSFGRCCWKLGCLGGVYVVRWLIWLVRQIMSGLVSGKRVDLLNDYIR